MNIPMPPRRREVRGRITPGMWFAMGLAVGLMLPLWGKILTK
ncbi:hypothetical protein [Victivallis vadensis]